MLSKNLFPKALLSASYEPLVLAILANGESYGYEIIQEIRKLSGGRITWAANRLYPLLHKLENQGTIQASWRQMDSGPGRKYYSLTDAGAHALSQAKDDWLDLSALLSGLWQQAQAIPGNTPSPVAAG